MREKNQQLEQKPMEGLMAIVGNNASSEVTAQKVYCLFKKNKQGVTSRGWIGPFADIDQARNSVLQEVASHRDCMYSDIIYTVPADE